MMRNLWAGRTALFDQNKFSQTSNSGLVEKHSKIGSVPMTQDRRKKETQKLALKPLG
jgi:hypothetical protein